MKEKKRKIRKNLKERPRTNHRKAGLAELAEENIQ
jgi:hypothetical protein